MGAFILGCYGLHEWFADIEQKRAYWKEGQGILGNILDSLSNEWFEEFVQEHGGKWTDAQEYRNRHLIRAINNRSFF